MIRTRNRARAAKVRRSKNFVIVPLANNWGYRAVTAAGRGAAIVLYALYKQRTSNQTQVPITAAVLKQCGVTRKMRRLTIDRLVWEGFATVRYRGKFRGCPLLTLRPPAV
jgi:hypothetical protein